MGSRLHTSRNAEERRSSHDRTHTRNDIHLVNNPTTRVVLLSRLGELDAAVGAPPILVAALELGEPGVVSRVGLVDRIEQAGWTKVLGEGVCK